MKIEIKNQNVFFTSDLHLFHHNVIRFDARPFLNIPEMNQAILDNWNSVVKEDDIVFNLGDAVHHYQGLNEDLTEFLNKFNGKIFYIRGNHEDNLEAIKNSKWTVLGDRIQNIHIAEDNQWINLCHFPIRVWDKAHYGSWHLFGHLHGGCKDDNLDPLNEDLRLKCLDVGIMNNEFMPFSYQQVKEFMATCSNDYSFHKSLNRFK